MDNQTRPGPEIRRCSEWGNDMYITLDLAYPNHSSATSFIHCRCPSPFIRSCLRFIKFVNTNTLLISTGWQSLQRDLIQQKKVYSSWLVPGSEYQAQIHIHTMPRSFWFTTSKSQPAEFHCTRSFYFPPRINLPNFLFIPSSSAP